MGFYFFHFCYSQQKNLLKPSGGSVPGPGWGGHQESDSQLLVGHHWHQLVVWVCSWMPCFPALTSEEWNSRDRRGFTLQVEGLHHLMIHRPSEDLPLHPPTAWPRVRGSEGQHLDLSSERSEKERSLSPNSTGNS